MTDIIKSRDGVLRRNADSGDGTYAEEASVRASATSSSAVTPSDVTLLNFRALYVGVTGNIAIKHTSSGTAVTYVAVPAGTILPVETGTGGGLVMATNTTASSIVAMDW